MAERKTKIVHIVEHIGYGTLHKLVKNLEKNPLQEVVFTNGKNNIVFKKDTYYIVHVTGHMYPIISNISSLLKRGIKIILFIHVAPHYFFLKDKQEFLHYIFNLQEKYNVKCLCPSNEVSREFLKFNIIVTPIQIGILPIKFEKMNNLKRRSLECFANKIVTVCTSSNPKYIKIKGIDKFYNLIEKNNCKNKALILGFDGNYKGIPCVKLTEKEFEYVLSKSIMYVQLSRSECYNITAIQAKQLKVPVLVTDIEGHKDSLPNNRNRAIDYQDILGKFLTILNGKFDSDLVESNYYDSIERESVDNFIVQINEFIGGIEHGN